MSDTQQEALFVPMEEKANVADPARVEDEHNRAKPEQTHVAGDRDVITFSFSGGNLGGQAVLTCSKCFALVQESGTGGHVRDHESGGV